LGLKEIKHKGCIVTNDIPLSIVIIAFNEEKRLEQCLSHLVHGAEIIVLDSGSSDRTVEIAKKHGALVYDRTFDNFAAQKNAAVAHATRKWVLSLDADEVMGEDLRGAVQEVILMPENETSYTAYKIKRSLVYMGKKLRFGKAQDYPIRLFQRQKAQFVGEIHEKLDVQGKIGLLKGGLLHYSYENLDDYFNRFNLYTKKIAQNHLKKGKVVLLPLHFMRPGAEFLYRYFIRLGCLDGAAGFSYALVSSLYAFVKYEKLREIYLLEKKKKK
jgi:glycosyltransferase involved in cell wall biosynthesis